jgi:hypothetical protein
MANNPSCTVTVGQFTACMQAVKANACVTTFLTDPACVNVTTVACLVVITNATSALMTAAK